MSNNWPKEWISVVLSRFDRLLELSVTQNTSLTSTIDNHKACLINISQSKCLAVIRGLTSSLKKLSNIRIYGERQEYNLYNAQVVVLDLLGKCIAVKDLTLAGDSVLMRLLLCEVCQFLHQSTPDNPALSQLQSSASHVLYRISRNNFAVVFARISSRLQELTLSNDELADLSDLFLIQHIYLDLGRISKILEDVAKCFKLLRRPFQNALLSILDKALCDWLSSFPLDLNLLYKPHGSGGEASVEQVEEQRKMNATLSFNAEMLFHMVDNFSEGIKKKSVPYWPLQTSLLILCPELLKQIANNPDEVKNTKLELLPHIKKSLSNPTSRHLHECCITAIIRLFKAATSISPPSEGEDGSLQKIVRELLPLVQSFLFENGSKFAKVCCRDLLIDCFICSYRLEPTKHNLAKFCASSVSSILHKMVWMNALLCISSQPTHPWWPCMDGMLVYGPDVRKIFYDCSAKTQTLYQTSPKNAQTLREKMNVSLKRSQDDSPSCKDLLHVILQLVHQNPSFILHNMGGSPQQIHQNLSEFFNTLVSLIDLKNTPNIPCSLASLEALVRLNEPQCVVGWNPEYMMVTYWEISSNVILTICEKVLTQQMMMSPDMLSHAIKWLNKMLAYRIEFLVQNHDKPGVNNKADVVKRAQLKTELVLLEQLWNSNPEIVLIALNCFHCLNEENEIKWSLNEFTMARLFPDNHEVYHHLSSCDVCEDGIQIKVAKKLRLVNKFTRACLEAWEDTQRKWEIRTNQLRSKKDENNVEVSIVGKSMTRKTLFNRQDLVEWTNVTRYLCSLGGVCVKYVEPPPTNQQCLGTQRTSVSSTQSSCPTPSALVMSQETAMEKIPERSTSSSVNRANTFISSLLTLVANNGSNFHDISEITRDLLSSSLHPSLIPTLLLEIKLYLKNNLFDASDHVVGGASNDHFVGNVISIIERVFGECSEGDRNYLSEGSVEVMLLHVVRYVRHMGSSGLAFKLRIRFCSMICKVMERKDDLFFLFEIKFRNKLVEHVTDWLMCSAIQTVDIDKHVLRELDQCAVIAVGVLLKGLPLHPDEGDGGDVPEAKSQLFLKYFTLFMKLLGECSDKLAESELLDESASEDTVTLRRLIIVAMSNLLSANIESGLVHAMSLAYHDEVQTRSAFLEVLTKIVQQGSDGFQTLGDSVSTERFERLVELVTMMGDNGELPIANALANVVHTSYMDELARVFVTLFDAKHLLYQLLWNMFTKEVEEADSVQTLFRGNSLASKIMTFCFKVYGASYLHNLVEPLVAWSLTQDIVNLHFEVDQKRIPPGYDILQCRANLQRLTERFFTRIMTSTDKFPPQLKSVCHCLYQVVSQRFHESGTGAVASAIFLRFLNPAIATPYEYGLSDRRLPPNLARAFKFMCKIMQNIANHVVFTKEEHMKHFNEFVSARFDVCQQFFMQISTPECASVESSGQSTSFMNDTNVSALHRLLWNDQEKIGRYLAKSRNAKAVGRRPFDKMVTLLAYIGPPEYTRPVLETRMTGQNILPCKFEELMTKRKAADSEEYKLVKGLNIFYQFGRSKMGYPVFYYVARRYVLHNIREDILMFYILQALKPYSARKFDIIIDLTHVGAKNRFRGQYLPKWLVLYPQQIYKNLDTVYVYNPNTWVKDYVSYNEGSFNQVEGHRSIHFIEDLLELKKFIELDHQKVPSATRGLGEDVTVYHNAWRLGQIHNKVHVKVGSKAVQLTMVDKTKLLGYDVVLNDIYYAHEIEAIHFTEATNTFSLKVSTNNNAVMSFTHPDAAKIVEGIRYIRNRWEISQPQQMVSHHKIEAKDVPGTLLNMALLNLGCSKPLVRSSAYNLLCVLTTAFNLQLEGRLCESDGLCIPTNNALFIISISNTLARNENHLTLEFLEECITGFRYSNDKLKNLCLEYMEPWLFNLPSFASSDGIKRNKVKSVVEKLIDLTITEKDFYLSVQTKIWGNFGQMTSLVDLVLECFIETSSQGGLGSVKAEVMADTSVALAAHNMKLVSSKIIKRLCRLVDKTSLRPTPTLEKHKHWEEIAILARYLLMLSFNNNLDVAAHLPYLFHLVSLLVSTGPLTLRASIHGLVVNIIHSLLTCKQIEFKEETQQILRLSLTEFCLPKFYTLFGIPQVKSAADAAFKSEAIVLGHHPSVRHQHDSAVSSCHDNDDVINLGYLDTVVDAMLEVMEACMKDIRGSDWLNEWLDLSHKFAFQYNPSLQPRALVVLGCIAKHGSLRHVKQILGIMERSLEPQPDPVLLEASVLCLTRMQLIINAKPEFHVNFFWLGIAMMQLNEKNLFAAGILLVEQNLHNLDELDAFVQQPSIILMNCKVDRHPLDTTVNVCFKSDFHFAFVTYLLKGFRHNDSTVVSRVVRILDFSLELISRHRGCNKYDVNLDSLPYIAALLPVCADARRYCVPRRKPDSSNISASSSKPIVDQTTVDESANISDENPPTRDPTLQEPPSTPTNPTTTTDKPRKHATKVKKSTETARDSDSSSSSASHVTSSSMTSSMRSSRRKHSTDVASNVLLDDEMLGQKHQALLLTILATQVCHTPNKSDVQIIYEYLAEASSVFPAVFPIVHSLLDQKINSVLNYCEDPVVLSHVQVIVRNALLCVDDNIIRNISFIQDIGFGGLCKFVGPFAKVPSLEHSSIIVKLIDSLITTYLMDVPDLTPVQSRLSISSALSAASLDAVHESEDSDVTNGNGQNFDLDSRQPPSGHGNFRNRGPKLTIKVPNN